MKKSALSFVAVAVFALAILAACDAEQELTDPKDYPYESLPAFLTAEDFDEIQLDMASVLPCPDGATALASFTARNQAFGLTVMYELGMRATVQTQSNDGVDTVVALFGPDDGNGYYGALPIALDDDGGPDGQLSSLVETIDEAGRYFVVVTTAGGRGLGDVTLLVGAQNCEATPVGCQADDDCAADQVCVDGLCVDDTNRCYTDSDCEDADPCLMAVCIDGVCVIETMPVGTSCDDGDPCTGNDVCENGECVGAELNCDDADECTTDFCDPAAGACVNEPIPGCGFPCTADDDCEAGYVCMDGLCVEMPVGCTSDAECFDDNPCTEDSCVDGECLFIPAPEGLVCDDGDPCTTDDLCLAGACVGTPVPDPDCGQLACSMNADCPSDMVCMDGLCVSDPAFCVVDSDCDDSNACTTDLCDATTGQCVYIEEENCGLPCSADDDCAMGQVCMSGVCVDIEDPCALILCDAGYVCVNGECVESDPAFCVEDSECDDGNACTTDLCDATTGQCLHIMDPACGPVCTTDADCDAGYVCMENVCVPYDGCLTSADCDDANVCTDDACVNGECLHTVSPAGTACDDGDPCTLEDACQEGVCVGDPLDCDDGNVCTLDYCDAATGACVHTLDPACD